MTADAPAVEARELTRRYGARLAVDRVSFRVERGEIVALLGPNGAGKSTTIRMLTCFMPASSGEATVAGHDIWTDSLEVRRRLGYMPESMPLYVEMRVREYLEYRARLKGVPRRERRARVRSVAERCWVSDVLDRIIGQLSKGYRQRVGLAESLVHDPEILILDEPTIGLDPRQIVQARELIREVGRERTVILSTHILPEAESLADRVLIMDRGRLAPEEEIARLRSRSRVRVVVAGDGTAVRRALGGVKGVTRVEALAPGEGGAHVFELDGGSGPEVREEAARRLVEAGLPPREIRLSGATLEEVFVRITSTD